ncbi:MAG: Ser-Thr-rich glycosyl-phosphatidyl-inositol-anchored membrane family protein [Bacteroidetes bacterium ADurb.Bin408]|nr:MAG: Ser-Thr-rich glycosyl-phosphatidyl-inositol-anchored membrane family protein [Bacteroidetes bacterium ADurb.Bin408]
MPNGNTYYWQVPFQITNQALIRARFLSIAQLYDESNNLFSIVYPSFALIEPINPGLSFYPNTQTEIKWIATSTNYIKILFSPDNGQTWTLVQDSVPAASGSYLWTIPNLPSTMCKIRIVDVNDNLIYDTSDYPFTIGYLPNLILVSPNGGENYVKGDSILIRWLGSYLTGGLYLDYSIDSGATWINITSKWGNPNGDSYTWIAPAIIAKVLIRVSYIDIPVINDQSDGTFTICFYPAVYATQYPVVCQPNTVDITAYIADSLNASGTYNYWLDIQAIQPLNNPYQVSTSGIYYITKHTTYGGCTDTTSIEILVGTTPSPPVIASQQHLCSGDTAAVIEATGINIYWYADSLLAVLIDTGQSIPASQFNSDTVLYLTQFVYPACPSPPAQIEINYFQTPLPPQATIPSPYCAGDSVAPLVVGGTNINWYDDVSLTNLVNQGNMLSLPPLYNDTVFYVTQNVSNCESMPMILPVEINPIPSKPTISQSGMDIVSSSPVGNQWFNDQGQMLDTNQYFTPPVDGFYYVVVTINGCVSDTSDIIYYYITGNQLHDAVGNGLFVYPNPFNDVMFIYNYSNTEASYNVEIYNTISQKLYANTLKFDEHTHVYSINPGNLPKGAYILYLKGDRDNIVTKIIKH